MNSPVGTAVPTPQGLWPITVEPFDFKKAKFKWVGQHRIQLEYVDTFKHSYVVAEVGYYTRKINKRKKNQDKKIYPIGLTDSNGTKIIMTSSDVENYLSLMADILEKMY